MAYSAFLGDDTVAIFLFHGVIPEQRHTVRNYTRKHLLRERFESVLDDLCSTGTPVSMDDIVASARRNRCLPSRAFALTFDDGFKNNCSVAAPILVTYGLPATFYITTAFVDENGCSWIDMIEYAVEATDGFELSLPFPGPHVSYKTVPEKRDLLEAVRRFVKGDPDIDPYAFAREVWRQLGVSRMEPDLYLDEKMSWADVRELSRHPLFTIGGHGHTHRILEYLDQSELEREVAVSMARLRSSLDVPVSHYSYPEGLSTCYSERVIRLLQSHGIICAPTAEPGINGVGDDLFRLKRVMVT